MEICIGILSKLSHIISKRLKYLQYINFEESVKHYWRKNESELTYGYTTTNTTTSKAKISKRQKHITQHLTGTKSVLSIGMVITTQLEYVTVPQAQLSRSPQKHCKQSDVDKKNAKSKTLLPICQSRNCGDFVLFLSSRNKMFGKRGSTVLTNREPTLDPPMIKKQHFWVTISCHLI